MATIASRLTSQGNILVNGSFDETTYTNVRVTSDTVYSSLFDEVTGMSSANGLIFYVDPGDTASYPGSGTRINDIQTTTTVGTTQNSPTFTATAPGYFTYNGTSQYIDFGNTPLAEVQDKSVMGWVYVNATGAIYSIIDKEFDSGASNYGGWGFWVGPITGGNGLWFWTQANKDLKDTTVLSTNTWYHVAVVWNYTSKSATFYVNGVAKTTQTDATIVEKVSDSTSLKIGAMRSVVSNYFSGRIGAVQVYNRQLSASEILNNYNADAARYGYTPTATVPVKRDTSTGSTYILGQFDELTGAPVIDGNLRFWLDAAQTNSYSGSGSTWNDLSTSSSNVTLFGSPTFSSAVTGGNITFVPASTQYGMTTTNLGSMPTWTVEAWVKVNADLNGVVSSIVCNEFDGSNLNFSIGTNRSPGSYTLCIGFFNGAWRNTTGFIPTTGLWYQVVGSYDGSYLYQYVNGSIEGLPVFYSGTAASGGNIRIARRWDSDTSSGNLFPGDIAVVRIYNRPLTADEVSQNFNAHRRRFNR